MTQQYFFFLICDLVLFSNKNIKKQNERVEISKFENKHDKEF